MKIWFVILNSLLWWIYLIFFFHFNKKRVFNIFLNILNIFFSVKFLTQIEEE